MSYIKIVRKVSAGVFENYYVGTDIKSITLTFTDNGDNTNVTSIAIATVSGVIHTLLTQLKKDLILQVLLVK